MDMNEEMKADLKEYLLSSLDALEKYFQETENIWDDLIALPAIAFLKKRVIRDI
jgi:hypothetical protein